MGMSAFVRPGDPSTTLLEPSGGFCQSPSHREMRLLVVVFSAPDHTARRDVIRKTWGKEMLKLPGVKMVFNFGKSRTIEQQKQLESEHRVYNDVLQHEFVDSFSNLTLKTAFALKWVTSGNPLNNCSVKFVYKTDDDTFVNPGK